MNSRRLAVLSLRNVSLGVSFRLVVNLELVLGQFNPGTESLFGEDETDDLQLLALAQRLLDDLLLGVNIVVVGTVRRP